MLEEPIPKPPEVRHPRGKRSAYMKISLRARLVFFRKVVHEGGDLRQVSPFPYRSPGGSISSTPLPKPWSATTALRLSKITMS